MTKIFLALLTFFALHAVARAADKITIGVPELNAQFVPLALAERKGFFREDGIQADVIRINPTVALAALVSGELDYWTVIGNSVAAGAEKACQSGARNFSQRSRRSFDSKTSAKGAGNQVIAISDFRFSISGQTEAM